MVWIWLLYHYAQHELVPGLGCHEVTLVYDFTVYVGIRSSLSVLGWKWSGSIWIDCGRDLDYWHLAHVLDIDQSAAVISVHAEVPQEGHGCNWIKVRSQHTEGSGVGVGIELEIPCDQLPDNLLLHRRVSSFPLIPKKWFFETMAESKIL